MEVKISTQGRNRWSDEQWNTLKAATRWFLDRYNLLEPAKNLPRTDGKAVYHPRATRTLIIEYGSRKLPFLTHGQFIHPAGVLDLPPHFPVTYKIQVGKHPLFSFVLNTLFHELVHLHQTETGMKREVLEVPIIGDVSHCLWGTQKVDKSVRYSDLPWEIDAKIRADALVKEWYELNPRTGINKILFWRI